MAVDRTVAHVEGPRHVHDGGLRGEFAACDAAVVGRAVLHATARFHHPAHAAERSEGATLAADPEAVFDLLLAGLLTRE